MATTTNTLEIVEQVDSAKNNAPLIRIKRGQLFTTSLDLAANFGKRHDAVLRAIRNLDCSENFMLRNYVAREYVDERGNAQPMYEISRDGFTFLIMGFRGVNAAYWKEKYIDAFNSMETVLANQANPAWNELRKQGKLSRFEETDTIKLFVAYAERQGSINARKYYCIITKATNTSLFLIPAEKPDCIRSLLDNMQLSYLQTAEFIVINTLKQGMSSNLYYKDIYKLCKARLQAFAENVGPTPVINDSQKMILAANS